MVRVGLLVRLRAKLGKEAEVAKFLEGALPAAQAEARTPVWFAIRLSTGEFGIFDAFADNAGREEPPRIEPVDVLAAKVTT